MTKTCTILIGPPAAGKSTWCYNHNGYGHIISSDDVIEEVAEAFNLTYSECFSTLVDFANMIFWKRLSHISNLGEDFIVDRTNMSIQSRKKIIDIVKQHGYAVNAVVFPAPEKTEWNRRLASRPGKTIPDYVITNMMKSFQFPSLEEGFNSIDVYEPEYS